MSDKEQQHISLFYLMQDFIAQWSLGNEAATEDASASQLGLAWLIPLWVDRDQEVLGGGAKNFNVVLLFKCQFMQTSSLFWLSCCRFALQFVLTNIISD